MGYLKAAIVVYPLPEDGSLGSLINLGSGSHFPPSEPIEVEVRIYIIKVWSVHYVYIHRPL